MSALQWALLVLSVVIVVAIVALSRREKPPRDAQPDSGQEPLLPPPTRPAASRQMDIFARNADAAGGEAPALPYDEFGVGKARRRQAPSLQGGADDAEPAGFLPAAPLVPEPQLPEDDAALDAEPAPAPEAPRAPAFLRAPSAAAPVQKSERIVTLLIAEREGMPILGPKIHTALKAQGLHFGAKQIYHRMAGDRTVFSVASLVKPGLLVPDEAAHFSTPGLSVFMVLPGPVQPVVALQDMMTTAQTLARALNAEVYDSRKQPLNADAMRLLQNDIEAWWRGQ